MKIQVLLHLKFSYITNPETEFLGFATAGQGPHKPNDWGSVFLYYLLFRGLIFIVFLIHILDRKTASKTKKKGKSASKKKEEALAAKEQSNIRDYAVEYAR